jgi:hypothetical protein
VIWKNQGYWPATPNDILLYQHDTNQGEGSVWANQKLNTDYTLDSNSPCIDKGANLSTYFTEDYNNTTRPQGSAWDMGAYEYVNTTLTDVCSTYLERYTTEQLNIEITKWTSEQIDLKEIIKKIKLWKYCP